MRWISERLTSASRSRSEAPATCCAASRVNPPKKTDSPARIPRSRSDSSRHEWSNTARMLRCRSGTPRCSVSKKSRLLPISATISAGESISTHAAARRIPRGIPCTCRQISVTFSRSSAVHVAPGWARAARCKKSWTALCWRASAEAPRPGRPSPARGGGVLPARSGRRGTSPGP